VDGAPSAELPVGVLAVYIFASKFFDGDIGVVPVPSRVFLMDERSPRGQMRLFCQ
jgi:hypothetical protein